MRRISRRLFGGFIATCAMLLIMGAASAQEIRYFVVQSSGVFEVKNAATGGRFVIAPTSERINVPGRGSLQVRGYTDRAQRLETVATHLRGSGVASVSVTYCPPGGSTRTIFAGNLGLPVVVPQTVSANTSFDNITVNVFQNGRWVTRRLPIGSRP